MTISTLHFPRRVAMQPTLTTIDDETFTQNPRPSRALPPPPCLYDSPNTHHHHRHRANADFFYECYDMASDL